MGLVSLWKMNEKTGTAVADSTGLNPGTSTNTIVGTTGKVGSAITLGANADDAITVTASSSLDISSMLGFSFACWAYITDDGGNDVGRIYDKAKSRFNVTSKSGSDIKVLGILFRSGVDASFSITNRFSMNVWHHLVMTWNGIQLTFYLDGTTPAQTPVTGDGTVDDDSGDNLIIGNIAAGDRNFDGNLDDVRVYNHALSAVEVSALYSGEAERRSYRRSRYN